MKLSEMVSEYEANIAAMKQRREALIAERETETRQEHRYRLARRIKNLEACIGQSQLALYEMRRCIRGK